VPLTSAGDETGVVEDREVLGNGARRKGRVGGPGSMVEAGSSSDCRRLARVVAEQPSERVGARRDRWFATALRYREPGTPGWAGRGAP